MICLVFCAALYQIAILLIFDFAGTRILRLRNESQYNAERIKNTFIFSTSVFCQVGWDFLLILES
jgi:P-type Ca2+ transporter type 2C